MIYGYMRVSTVGQVKGNSLEEQERILRQNGATVLYQDVFTGTKTSRPPFPEFAVSGRPAAPLLPDNAH